jgi:exo-beta-1,3-glucanase (GH17 family)
LYSSVQKATIQKANRVWFGGFMEMVHFQKLTPKLGYVLILLGLLVVNTSSVQSAQAAARGTARGLVASQLKCVAFSPYLQNYNPNTNNHPPTSLIDNLLDVIVQETDYNCIMVYGASPPLDHIFPAAQARGLKVFMNIWLEPGLIIPSHNSTSIQDGIDAALAYPDTIVRLSCGVEVRNRATNNGLPLSAAEMVINDCIDQLRTAGVTQPITTIDTWWNWCNAHSPCQTWSMANNVDWIGVNVYPWWENKYSGIFTCISAADAPQFHIDRINNIQGTYPSKEIVLTEFGWPAGPDGYSEANLYTGQRCGIASESNQDYVISQTLTKLNNAGIQGVVFESFREPWKIAEGPVGPFWGTITPTFPDVAFTYWAHDWIERLYQDGITGGCGTNPLAYCPEGTVTRAQMAVFLLRGIHGPGYIPPPVGPGTGFGDVSPNYWAAAWIKQLAAEGITGGCGSGNYCPESPVTRAQMAIFLLRSKHGSSYSPPAVGGSTGFTDVAPTYWAAAWIKQLVAEGITAGCGTGTYCPELPVTRAQMAVFLVRTFNLP